MNDTAERDVTLMHINYKNLLTKDEQKQFMLHVVKEHEEMFENCKKNTLLTSQFIKMHSQFTKELQEICLH